MLLPNLINKNRDSASSLSQNSNPIELRKQMTPEQMRMAIKFLIDHLQSKLDQKGWGRLVSSHEVLGVLTEEVHECTEAVISNDDVRIAEELLDVAVAAIFGYASLERDTLQAWLNRIEVEDAD